MEVYDVVVIGAGPAGSMAARMLGEEGRRVLLLEKGLFPGRKKACGGMLPYQVLKEYGISEDLIETRMEREIFVFPWLRRVTRQNNITIQRSHFDEHLAVKAQEAGAELVTSCRVTDVTRDRNGQMMVTARCGRENMSVRSSVVVFAHGVHSLAYRTMGIGFNKQKRNVGFGIEFGVEFPDNGMKDYYVYFGLKRLTWGYLWLFPNKDVLNVGVYLLPTALRTHPYKNNMLEYFKDVPDCEVVRSLANRRIVKRIGGFIPLEPASSLCGDGVVAVGDAAGLVFPFTAGGIGTALYSGKLAGEVISRALSRGDCSSKGLSSYERRMRGLPFYRTMKRESFIFKVASRFGHIHPAIYSKLFCLWKLRSELSSSAIVKTITYPLLGSFSQLK